jgi:ankyrin repeat protein
MELAGLFVGVGGLVGVCTACLDVIERVDAYKEFGIEAHNIIARFQADKVRLRRWATELGISDGTSKESLDPRLQDPITETAVIELLDSARELFDATEIIRSKLRTNSLKSNGPFLSIPGALTTITKSGNSPSTSVRGGLGWAIRRRGKFTNHAGMFSETVDLLYNFVPPASAEYQALNGVQQDVRSLLEDMLRRKILQSRDAIDEWLAVKDFNNRYDVSQYYDEQVSSRLAGTCEWIKCHPAYLTWISNNPPDGRARLLWICASAGSGKTTLCASLVEHLKESKASPVAYFFASLHAQSGGKPSFILRSWIAQIARLDPDIHDLLVGHTGTGQGATDSVIWSVFSSITAHSENYAFVLDGFDEYDRRDDARTEFLEKLKDTIKGTATKVLIFSRDETDIKAALDPSIYQGTEHVMLQCKISKEDVQQDISLFSRSVIDKKLPNKTFVLRENLAGQLAEKCDGMFLWIKLQQNQIRKGQNARDLQDTIKNMPVGLDRTYERNWKYIQSRLPKDQDRALTILRWTIFAFRPLTVAEITEALFFEGIDDEANVDLDELDENIQNIDDDHISTEIVEMCADLIQVRTEKPGADPASRTIHVIHPSVREYLLATLPFKHSSILDQTWSHAKHQSCNATVCLAYLNCQDVWLKEDTEYKYAFLDYAAQCWDVHVTAGKDDSKVVGRVNRFLRAGNGNFLKWAGLFELASAKREDETAARHPTAGTPLYYAAYFGLTLSMESIIAEDPSQLDTVGGEYGTPLQAVCSEGHRSAFDLLIYWGANLNMQGGKFGSPINAAIYKGRRSIAKSLIRLGADPELTSAHGTPLVSAAYTGDCEIAGLLIEAGADVNYASNFIPLCIAASAGYFELVMLLLERGANINIAPGTGWYPLATASIGGHVEVVRALLELGADVNIADGSGATSLQAASYHGHLGVVKILLDKNANIELFDHDGCTPLYAAIWKGNHDIVKLLLEKGANTAISTKGGSRPMSTAASQGHVEVVKILLEHGVDKNIVDADGWTPLHAAVRNSRLEVARLLIQAGADVTIPTTSGRTLLHTAAETGSFEVAKLLLDVGAKATAVNVKFKGWTPLHLAVESGHRGLVEYLMNQGADPEMANRFDYRSLDMALQQNHLEIIRLLIDRNVDVASQSPSYGNAMNHLAYKGQTDLLRLIYEKDHTKRLIIDRRGRSALQLAALGGHFETFHYLISLGFDPNLKDFSGNSLPFYASCSGSPQISNTVFDMSIVHSPLYGNWSLLHWACRRGVADVVEHLINRGLKSGVVVTSKPEGRWSPATIAIYHGQEKILTDSSSVVKSQLSLDAYLNPETTVTMGGILHEGFTCDGCEMVSRNSVVFVQLSP